MSTQTITDLDITNYSDKSIAVYGNTRDHKDSLKALGGKYNSRLRDGPGWIFPKSLENDLRNFMETGEVPPIKDYRDGGPRTGSPLRRPLIRSSTNRRNAEDCEKLYRKMETGMKRIETILAKLASVYQAATVIPRTPTDDENESEEEKVPQRLMRKARK